MTRTSVTFSVVVATSGRPSLSQTLASLTPQLAPGDEVLIVRDSTGDWGHTARNNAMPRCAGTHLLFIDDDDRYLKDALDFIREQVARTPNRVHLFSMVYEDGRVVQPTWPLRVGHVGTPMLCIPNTENKLGEWSNRYEGDYDFIQSTMELRHDAPVMHSDVIATVAKPQR